MATVTPLKNKKTSTLRRRPVRQTAFAEMIRRALRDQYDAVLAEPLPQRWLELINGLYAVEGHERRERTEQDHNPSPAAPRAKMRVN